MPTKPKKHTGQSPVMPEDQVDTDEYEEQCDSVCKEQTGEAEYIYNKKSRKWVKLGGNNKKNDIKVS